MDCPFCYDQIQNKIIDHYHSVFAIKDEYPVAEGHLLIIPNRHCQDYFEMTMEEIWDIHHFINLLKKNIVSEDSTVTGFNIGINIGVSAGQTIFHTHIHLIPRRDKDTPNPRGGVRGVIPDKMSYPF